jgi:tetratricopeptide (TPR) repeat protein
MKQSPAVVERTLRTLPIVVLVAVVLGGAALAEGEVRVRVKVTDESGNPVPDLKIVLAPDEDVPKRDMTTNKKGVATIPNLRPASYRPTLDSSDYRLASIAYSARGGDGVRQATFREDDVQQNGSPTIQFKAFSRAELEIGVASAPAVPATQGDAGLHGLVEARGRLEVLNALFDLQQWEELIEQSDEVLGEDPDNGGAHYLRGVALWRTGNYEEAERHLSRAVTLLSDQPGIHGVLGALYLEHANALREQGGADEVAVLGGRAAEELSKQLELTPGVKTHLTNLVIALELAGRSEEARTALERLIAANPEDPKPYLRLADLQIEAGQAEEAVRTLNSMPGAGAEVVDFLYNAAVVMWNEDKLDATIATMARAIELDPENGLLHQLKGRAHIAKGETDQGIAELEEFIRLASPEENVEIERKLIEALKQQS